MESIEAQKRKIVNDAANSVSEAWQEYAAASTASQEAKMFLKLAEEEKSNLYDGSNSPAVKTSLTKK